MLDRANNNFIVEDLDDTHLVVQESMLTLLKQQLDTVRPPIIWPFRVHSHVNTDRSPRSLKEHNSQTSYSTIQNEQTNGDVERDYDYTRIRLAKRTWLRRLYEQIRGYRS